jgi:hypothetical protein
VDRIVDQRVEVYILHGANYGVQWRTGQPPRSDRSPSQQGKLAEMPTDGPVRWLDDISHRSGDPARLGCE